MTVEVERAIEALEPSKRSCGIRRDQSARRSRRFPPPWTDSIGARLGFNKGTSVGLLLLKNFGQQTTT